jgi:hypothetical protein
MKPALTAAPTDAPTKEVPRIQINTFIADIGNSSTTSFVESLRVLTAAIFDLDTLAAVNVTLVATHPTDGRRGLYTVIVSVDNVVAANQGACQNAQKPAACEASLARNLTEADIDPAIWELLLEVCVEDRITCVGTAPAPVVNTTQEPNAPGYTRRDTPLRVALISAVLVLVAVLLLLLVLWWQRKFGAGAAGDQKAKKVQNDNNSSMTEIAPSYQINSDDISLDQDKESFMVSYL